MGGALTLDDNPGGGSVFAFAVTCRNARPADGRRAIATPRARGRGGR